MPSYWKTEEKAPAIIPGAKTYFPPRIYHRDDGIAVIPRYQFAVEYFEYASGEHVVFGGPSKHGKTQLCFDLLIPLASPKLPAYVAVSKPTDKVTLKRGQELGLRFVEDWPAKKKISEYFNGPPSGYVIWPKFGDVEKDFPNAAAVTARLIDDRYSASARSKSNTAPGILVMDDTMVKAKIMGLDNRMVTILAMAGAMQLGLWVFVQKPTDSGKTTLWAYENYDHLFLTKGGDTRMLRRYEEIAGDLGPTVRRVVPTLEKYQFLYIHDGNACIVDAAPPEIIVNDNPR